MAALRKKVRNSEGDVEDAMIRLWLLESRESSSRRLLERMVSMSMYRLRIDQVHLRKDKFGS